MKRRKVRTNTDPKSVPIRKATFDVLMLMLEQVYPGKVRRVIEVTPIAVTKTIDNEKDALATLRNIDARLSAPSSTKEQP